VWRLDRWGRSVTDLLATLQERSIWESVSFTDRSPGSDHACRSSHGALLAVFAEFEREILRERVRAGLAHARQNGQRLGRPLTAALHADQVRKLYRAGTSNPKSPAPGDRPDVGAAHPGSKQEMKCQRKESGFRRTSTKSSDPSRYEAADRRRLLVPAGLTLDALHDVLQLAMGWDGSHMHDFRIGQSGSGNPILPTG